MESDSPQDLIATGLPKLLARVGAIAGSVVGLATVAFAGGFLAQRAQYDFAQVPFVFVDYWSYAEIGLMSFVRSMYFLVEWPWALAIVSTLSVAIVVSLEFDRFRETVLQPHLVFLSYLILVVAALVLIRQELRVRNLRYEAPASARWSAQAVLHESKRKETVPATFPFRLFVRSPLNAPREEAIAFPRDSFAAWREIADELELQIGSGAQYQDLRPPPDWALTAKPDDDDESSDGSAPSPARRQYVLGRPITAEGLDASRALQLYRAILSAFVVLLWLLLLNGAWLGRIHAELLERRPARKLTGARALLWRLREEIWFTAKWVLRPLAALLLLTGGAFLMPECYGILAMARIGQEYVQVVTHNDGKRSEDGTAADDAEKTSSTEIKKLTEYGLELLQNCPVRDIELRRKLREDWEGTVTKLEHFESPLATKSLERLASASAAVAPDLVNVARDAWARASTRTSATLEGYILYYPRSETDYLRLLQRDPLSLENPWAIYPVSMSNIVDIRIKRDVKTLRLIDLLRAMRESDPSDRVASLLEAEHLGHPRLLEVAIAGTYDPSHEVRGPSITDVGRYAASLPPSEAGTLRRSVAATRLLTILTDPQEYPQHRTAAVSALNRFVPAGDPTVCTKLEGTLRSTLKSASDDEQAVAGSLVTTIGELRCPQGIQVLVDILRDEQVSDRVRSYVPSSLANVATFDDAGKALGEVINDNSTSIWLIRPALGALGGLQGGNPAEAVSALCRFLTKDTYPSRMTELGLVGDYRHAAIHALHTIGSANAASTLLVLMKDDPDPIVRGMSVTAVSEFAIAATEGEFVSVFENSEELEPVRRAAVRAVANFREETTLFVLVAHYPNESAEMRKAIRATLSRRAQRGSGLASTMLDELQRADDESEQLGAESSSL